MGTLVDAGLWDSGGSQFARRRRLANPYELGLSVDSVALKDVINDPLEFFRLFLGILADVLEHLDNKSGELVQRILCRHFEYGQKDGNQAT